MKGDQHFLKAPYVHVLTKKFLFFATEREQSLDESEVSCQEDVVCLTGLHLRAPAGLKVVKPRDLVFQHRGCTHF